MKARGRDTTRLIALLDGHVVGAVHQNPDGRFRFVYDEEWRQREDAYPISLSIPLTAQEHPHDVTNAYLWGLLPDNSALLDQYGRLFGVSSGNPVALLAHMGADCAGAIQFAPPERVEGLLADANAAQEIEWLTEGQVAEELRNIRLERVPGTNTRTSGQFSLAGAQPKIALLEDNGVWGRPNGRTPTTRILKPPASDLTGFAENEHFCLELAKSLGLGAVTSRVERFDDEVAIVVERFDRQKIGDHYRRIHQEDTCQALGVVPTRKYENEGGPGIKRLITLLRDYSRNAEEDVGRFVSAMAFNWVVAATDGHAKNYAILHGSGSDARLAPFYDIASYLPYTDTELHRVKLAMKIGSEYLVRRITPAKWADLATAIDVPIDSVLDKVRSTAELCASHADEVLNRAIGDGLTESLVQPLADRIQTRARYCFQQMTGYATHSARPNRALGLSSADDSSD